MVKTSLDAGISGVFHAIADAERYLATTGADQAIVGGVDTYRDHRLLGWLDAQDRLLATGVVDGFAPGEGAALFVLTRHPRLAYNTMNYVQLFPPCIASEEGHLYSREPCLGEGLSKAALGALDHRSNTPVRTILSSMTGENYWAKELGVMMTRTHDAYTDDLEIRHPADCMGDTGAGFAGIALGTMLHRPAGGYLVYGSSDGADRAAIFVKLSQHGRH